MSLSAKKLSVSATALFTVMMAGGCAMAPPTVIKQSLNKKTGAVEEKTYKGGKLVSTKPDNSEEGLALSKEYRQTVLKSKTDYNESTDTRVKWTVKQEAYFKFLDRGLKVATPESAREAARKLYVLLQSSDPAMQGRAKLEMKKRGISQEAGKIEFTVHQFKSAKRGSEDSQQAANAIIKARQDNQTSVDKSLSVNKVNYKDVVSAASKKLADCKLRKVPDVGGRTTYKVQCNGVPVAPPTGPYAPK